MTDLLRRLSPRERVLIFGAVLFISGTLLYGLIVSPLVSGQRRYRSMVTRQRDNLEQFRLLAAQYRDTESSLKNLEKALSERKSDTSLLAAMESEARKLGFADRIASMKPFNTDLDSGMVEASVEIKIEKMNLAELADFLTTVEESNLMARTARLRVKTRFDDPKLLDATVLVTALETR